MKRKITARTVLTAGALCAAFLLTLFVAYQTDQALCFALGIPHSYGAVYLLLGAFLVLFLIHEIMEPSWGFPWLNVTVGFAGCWFLYYAMLCAVWSVFCIALSITGTLHATGVASLALAAAVIVFLGFLHTKVIRRRSCRIALCSRGSTYRIGLISDVHLGAYVGKHHIARVVHAINEGSYDMVVIAGDLFDEDKTLLKKPSALDALSRQLGSIRTHDGVYLALGNHDPNAQDPAFVRFLRSSNIILLHNQALDMGSFTLIGRSNAAKNIRTACPAACPDKPVIIIDHDPQSIPEAVQQGADIVLSGHTHAGQLFPFDLFMRAAVGKDYFYGHHTFGKTHAIITSGAGIFNLPVRIGSSNEIVEVCIRMDPDPTLSETK